MNQIVDTPNAEYYAIKDRVSHSYLKNIDRSCAHYKMMLDAPAPSSDAQNLGTYLHALVLEPESAERDFVVVPNFGDQRKKENKLAKEAFIASLPPDARLVSAEQAADAIAMRDAIFRHDAARRLLDAVSATEVTCLFNRGGVECKARIDAIAPSLRTVIDIKTTQDASPAEYFRSCYKYSYHTQGEFYLHALNACQDVDFDTFVHIAVESTFKAVAVYMFPPELMQYATDINNKRLERVSNCQHNDSWPAYPNVITELPVPYWVYKQLEEI